MMKRITLFLAAVLLLSAPDADACTNLIVGKAASADGSVMVTYNCDTFGYAGWLTHSAAGRHAPGEKIAIRSFWHPDGIRGYVDQVEYTYNVLGYINEHQLCIVETTFGGREELVNPEGVLGYDNVIHLALERCKTAREAIRTMGELMDTYGYNDEGETFSVCDTDEAWIMEIVGKGPGRKGAVWVAVRIPDDCISAHANISRIRQFPQMSGRLRKGTRICEVEGVSMYSADVISFAREMGYYEGTDADFSFRDAYCPLTFLGVRLCDTRVWSFFRHHTDPAEMDSYLPYLDGKFAECDHLPLWIKPDALLSVGDVMADMRDHYEGTPLDMTADLSAGPWGMPVRPRAKYFTSGGKKYFRERPIASPQAGFTLLSHLRGWLPDAVGGVMYFNCDDPDMVAYVPVFCGTTEIPLPFRAEYNRNGEFDERGAFWMCNFVSNMVYPRYSAMKGTLDEARHELEDGYAVELEEVTRQAQALTPGECTALLNERVAAWTDRMMQRWDRLARTLIVRFNDQPGDYDQRFYDAIVTATGDRYLVPEE